MIRVLLVGLVFGRDFLHLYQLHPDVGHVGLCDTDPALLAEVGDLYGVRDRWLDLDAALAGGDYDVVHLATPVASHAALAVRVLRTGRSVGVAVPMATSLEDVDRVLEAASAGSGRYMMLETGVFGREYLEVSRAHAAGELGRLIHLRGAHLQDLDGFPPYWMGFPPMHYATHVLGPLLALARTQVRDVRCLGSGTLSDEHRGAHGPSFPWESALMTTGTDVAIEATVSFFDTARGYSEGFSVYGERGSFEWPQAEDDPPVTYRAAALGAPGRGRALEVRRAHAPDRPDLLPEALRPWTSSGPYTSPAGQVVSVSSTHSGSHAHLVHELVRTVAEGRPSVVDEVAAARMSAPGIVAHQSALAGGTVLPVPQYGDDVPRGGPLLPHSDEQDRPTRGRGTA
ncbi:Gfo/Idh/MocA family oxidoreductase [Cellulomonas sp. DKR-3]|uniref:Gfo/Idh/MocA family oxidoreductase n=1 Tax=Cellulomonas fulva TaxID=2835530 RepID=A0ABS5TV15_9CELL|nr:Gfo/Idh/MocA family oxidoreductase [Cellulomonas fulva]MBT0992978.1 Gfo/Idh/MocA family oxidoreductase [Cellulomonas fulva]